MSVQESVLISKRGEESSRRSSVLVFSFLEEAECVSVLMRQQCCVYDLVCSHLLHKGGVVAHTQCNCHQLHATFSRAIHTIHGAAHNAY